MIITEEEEIIITGIAIIIEETIIEEEEAIIIAIGAKTDIITTDIKKDLKSVEKKSWNIFVIMKNTVFLSIRGLITNANNFDKPSFWF